MPSCVRAGGVGASMTDWYKVWVDQRIKQCGTKSESKGLRAEREWD